MNKQLLKKQRREMIAQEIMNRRKDDILRGYIGNNADNHRRLLFDIGKQWRTTDGKVWTTRSYWLRYDRREYRGILDCLRIHYPNCTFLQCSPKKSYWYTDEVKMNHFTY